MQIRMRYLGPRFPRRRRRRSQPTGHLCRGLRLTIPAAAPEATWLQLGPHPLDLGIPSAQSGDVEYTGLNRPSPKPLHDAQMGEASFFLGTL